jgi:hypothetical protein
MDAVGVRQVLCQRGCDADAPGGEHVLEAFAKRGGHVRVIGFKFGCQPFAAFRLFVATGWAKTTLSLPPIVRARSFGW